MICLYECQNFPGNKIPGQKISRQNIPGWKILGPENSRNTYFSWNSRIFLWENSRIFFFRGQKIPGFLAPLISRIENSVTEFPRTFLAIFWLFWAKQDKTPPGEFGGEFGFSLRGHWYSMHAVFRPYLTPPPPLHACSTHLGNPTYKVCSQLRPPLPKNNSLTDGIKIIEEIMQFVTKK